MVFFFLFGLNILFCYLTVYSYLLPLNRCPRTIVCPAVAIFTIWLFLLLFLQLLFPENPRETFLLPHSWRAPPLTWISSFYSTSFLTVINWSVLILPTFPRGKQSGRCCQDPRLAPPHSRAAARRVLHGEIPSRYRRFIMQALINNGNLLVHYESLKPAAFYTSLVRCCTKREGKVVILNNTSRDPNDEKIITFGWLVRLPDHWTVYIDVY